MSNRISPPPIRAELSGSDRCSALGITAQAAAPVLMICKHLTDAGHDPATPLEAWRGDVLCLRVRSIGEGAKLEINANGTGFRPRRATDGAPPIAPIGVAGTRPAAPGVLPIYDGPTCAGVITRRDGRFVARDARGRELGAFTKLRNAVRAIPKTNQIQNHQQKD